jgi:hypothetical protein
MKKLVIIVFCSIISICNIFAREEAYTTFGSSYNNLFNITGDTIQPRNGYKGMSGFNLDCYAFWNDKNVGIFVVYNLLLPTYIMGNSNIDTYKGIMQETILGAGFRHIITNRLTLLGGLGFDFSMDSVSGELKNNTHYDSTMLNLGFNGQVGLKFDLTNVLCATIGLNTSYTFVTYTHINETSTNDSSKWMSKSVIGISPFVGIGFNRFDYKYWGKPEK